MRARWHRTALSAAVVMTAALVSAGSALAVTITAYSPLAGLADDPPYCPGGHVTITGTGFVNNGGVPSVTFGGGVKALDVKVGSDTTLYVMVPNGAATGPITVTTPAGTATTANLSATPTTTPIGELKLPSNLFTVLTCWGRTAYDATNPPTISRFAPAKAKAGATVTITGSGFSGATAVKIGSVAAKFTVVSGARITLTVPANAKTGKISVKTAAGTSTSATSFVKL